MQRRLLPNIPALLAIDAVARTGSFTAAARDLSLTQGAVSRQVAQLEGQLGVALVRRGARAATLTEAGAAYARRARAALDLLGQGAMEALGQAPERGLKLAILPTFGTRWLMPRIPRFVRRHPEVTLHFATRIGRFDLVAEGVDAAIHSGRGDWPGARLTLLMEERVMPVAAPGAAGVAGAPLLALNSRPTGWADWWGLTGRAGGAPAPAMRFEQVSTLAQAAAAGMGVALMPGFLIRPELESGALVPLGEEVPSGYGYYFVEPEGRVKPAVAQFRDWIVTETDRDVVV
ncbi:MAG: LysR family transcriptional regulator [Rhodobacter sp.]|uniref:LysR family transcriptional regulator n=1 Tax=Pararhodobacter sp. TaxID=2127056 RepID=UPI002C739F22|nr:LysR family transcriptional regulator [Pararhodobacter sp.]MCC0073947.1 LysR family transcriptional regulator [Rhodobacter sp.]HPD91343.1 LysR family transcriptional regulator [Pararhodobacter sp.]